MIYIYIHKWDIAVCFIFLTHNWVSAQFTLKKSADLKKASLPGTADLQCRASRRSHPKGKANDRSWSNSPWLPQKLLG